MFRRGVTTSLLLPQIDTYPGAQMLSVEAQLSAVHGSMGVPEAELVQKGSCSASCSTHLNKFMSTI